MCPSSPSFVLWEGTDVLCVPASALFRKGEGWELYVIDHDRARMREVATGRRTGLMVEVVSGLEAGVPVIAHPDDAIRDGVRVQARK